MDGFEFVGDAYFSTSNVFLDLSGNVLDINGVTVGYFSYSVTDSDEINMQFNYIKGDIMDVVIKGIITTVDLLKANDYDFE
jgi:hypothetical protein